MWRGRGGGSEMVFGREAITKVFLGAQQPWSTAEAATWALGSAEARAGMRVRVPTVLGWAGYRMRVLIQEGAKMTMLRIAWHGCSNYPPSLARETLGINILSHTCKPHSYFILEWENFNLL